MLGGLDVCEKRTLLALHFLGSKATFGELQRTLAQERSGHPGLASVGRAMSKPTLSKALRRLEAADLAEHRDSKYLLTPTPEVRAWLEPPLESCRQVLKNVDAHFRGRIESSGLEPREIPDGIEITRSIIYGPLLAAGELTAAELLPPLERAWLPLSAMVERAVDSADPPSRDRQRSAAGR